MRRAFIITFIILFALQALLIPIFPQAQWTLYITIPLAVIGIYDMLQPWHAILKNFPVLGHMRYIFESISPEIQQYFIERHTDGKPFSRNHRSLVYRRAKGVDDTVPFGTQHFIVNENYEGLKHSIYAKEPMKEAPRIRIGGTACKKPYDASLYNISAMSFGSLSKNAILALNKGAKIGGFYHNTGEGSLSDYHLEGGGDIVWQIGTGYFGCRTKDGDFNPEVFKEKAAHEQVRMIEIKISQGAKPGHGGVLPAIKNTPEIARIRGLEPYTTVFSPPSHKAFHDAKGLLDFVQQLRDLSEGKPVGFKLCIGQPQEFVEICEKMKETGIKPDFITVDGAEGGTGAAPVEFTDDVGLPIEPALILVHETLKKYGLRDEIKIIASGKVITGTALLKMLALGADLCNAARAFMFSVGCIQALRCNTNRCPTGVATQDPMLTRGLVVEEKKDRVANYHKNMLKATLELLGACGMDHPDQLHPGIFYRGDEFVNLLNRYFPDHLDVPHEYANN